MSDAEAEDIRRVLAICFRGETELDALDIERILSLDMGWLKPDEAETAVQALIKAGWLIGGQENLSPVADFQHPPRHSVGFHDHNDCSIQQHILKRLQ